MRGQDGQMSGLEQLKKGLDDQENASSDRPEKGAQYR